MNFIAFCQLHIFFYSQVILPAVIHFGKWCSWQRTTLLIGWFVAFGSVFSASRLWRNSFRSLSVFQFQLWLCSCGRFSCQMFLNSCVNFIFGKSTAVNFPREAWFVALNRKKIYNVFSAEGLQASKLTLTENLQELLTWFSFSIHLGTIQTWEIRAQKSWNFVRSYILFYCNTYWRVHQQKTSTAGSGCFVVRRIIFY